MHHACLFYPSCCKYPSTVPIGIRLWDEENNDEINQYRKSGLAALLLVVMAAQPVFASETMSVD